MHGLIVFPILTDLSAADGIVVKNRGIRQGFIDNGATLDVVEFTTKGVHFNGKLFYPFYKQKPLRVAQYRYQAWKQIAKQVSAYKYDFIWFRMPLIRRHLADFVGRLRREHPEARIILEYGYYPFVNELTRPGRFLYKLRRGMELKMHGNIDFVITYAGQAEVDGVPNIPINNGIDLARTTVTTITTDPRKQVNMISVSSLKVWHGYERLIAGIAAYMQQPGVTPVHFNIVGQGPEYDKLRTAVEELKVEPYITFHHFKIGAELDAIYNDNHLAIGTLGFHRIGITFSSSLKNREYFAKGLPIVLSTPDEDMPAGLPYVLYVPEGEAPLDVATLVDFAQKLYAQPGINAGIRAYAERTVSWTSKMAMVLDYVRRLKTA